VHTYLVFSWKYQFELEDSLIKMDLLGNMDGN